MSPAYPRGEEPLTSCHCQGYSLLLVINSPRNHASRLPTTDRASRAVKNQSQESNLKAERACRADWQQKISRDLLELATGFWCIARAAHRTRAVAPPVRTNLPDRVVSVCCMLKSVISAKTAALQLDFNMRSDFRPFGLAHPWALHASVAVQR